jgi:hypothetical protein
MIVHGHMILTIIIEIYEKGAMEILMPVGSKVETFRHF